MFLTREPSLQPPRDGFHKDAFGSPNLNFCVFADGITRVLLVPSSAVSPFGSLSLVHQVSHQCYSDKFAARVLSFQYLSHEEALGKSMRY